MVRRKSRSRSDRPRTRGRRHIGKPKDVVPSVVWHGDFGKGFSQFRQKVSVVANQLMLEWGSSEVRADSLERHFLQALQARIAALFPSNVIIESKTESWDLKVWTPDGPFAANVKREGSTLHLFTRSPSNS